MIDTVKFALSFEGLKEIPGPKHEHKIVEMFAFLGHDWVTDDETAWCAAFIGYVLEKCGIASTKALNALSYEDWGIPVDPDDIQPGDIVVRPRGTKAWQGHVEQVIERVGKKSIKTIGGNVSNSVKVSTSAISKWASIRRAGTRDVRVELSTTEIQTLLYGLGYFMVGKADGVVGPMTRAAIIAFKEDHGLPLTTVVDVVFEKALLEAKPRKVSVARATGAPEGSRIMSGGQAQIGLGLVGFLGATATQVSEALDKTREAVEQVGDAADAAGEVLDHADAAWEVFGSNGLLMASLPWIAAIGFAAVAFYGWKIVRARIEDHQTGKTP